MSKRMNEAAKLVDKSKLYDISEALDRAMKQDIGSDMIVNADMLYWAWFVPGFYGQHGWRIRGNANSSIMPLEPTQIVEE